MLDYTERDKYNDFPALIESIMNHLDFKRWGFEIVYTGKLFEISSAIIFQSEYCKVRVRTFRDRPYEQSEISYSYGRSHALNEKNMMEWNGKEYHCWHDRLNLYLVLGFLDGLSPQEVAQIKFSYVPDVLLKFNEKDSDWGHHESFAREQNVIWNHYGQRLFGFYDIRTPNLWNQYIDFVKEFRFLKEKKTPSSATFLASAYPTNIY